MHTHPFTSIRNALFLAMIVAWAGCTESSDTRPDPRTERGQDPAQAAPGDPTVAAATCPGHGAPAALCFRCDPALRDPGRLWCREHDRYEDRCWLCHPELRDEDRAYCEEHGLYEDECFFCDPNRAAGISPEPREPGSGNVLWCNEHGVPEAECGICHPEAVGGLAPGEGTKVRLPGATSATASGVRVSAPDRGSVGRSLSCLAEVTFNQNKLAQVVAPVGGVLERVDVDLGDGVEEGQVMARLWSAAIAEAVAKAVLTHQTLDREQTLHAQRVTSEKDLQEAEATHRAACQQLRTLGFTEEQIDQMGERPQESVLLEVRSPFAGEVVAREAVRGSLVEAGRTLFTVADRSVMWADLSIPESRLPELRPGQTVELILDAMPGRVFEGRLTWISASVDPRTRMALARAEIPNPDGHLRAGMFGRTRIRTAPTEQSLLVPVGAVQFVDNRALVFVRLEEDLYEARAVKLGVRENGHWQVLEGLTPSERVVTEQAFAVKSQLLLSRLGAGCAHE